MQLLLAVAFCVHLARRAIDIRTMHTTVCTKVKLLKMIIQMGINCSDQCRHHLHTKIEESITGTREQFSRTEVQSELAI